MALRKLKAGVLTQDGRLGVRFEDHSQVPACVWADVHATDEALALALLPRCPKICLDPVLFMAHA